MKKTKLLSILGISIMSLFLFSIMASAEWTTENKYIEGETIKPKLHFREQMAINSALARDFTDIRRNINEANFENYEKAQKMSLNRRLQPARIVRITKTNFGNKIRLFGELKRISGFQRQKLYFEQIIDQNSILKNLKIDDLITYRLVENTEISNYDVREKRYKAIIQI